MCGIAGGYNLEKEQVVEMCLSLHHRGPDSYGYYNDERSYATFGVGFGMGIARLAIEDVEDGDQPFSSTDGMVQVVFNGEIFIIGVL